MIDETSESELEKTKIRLKEFLESFSYSGQKKGKDYFLANRIENMNFNNGKLSANVRGTHLYETNIVFNKNEISYNCTCTAPLPCKHVSALAIYAIETNFKAVTKKFVVDQKNEIEKKSLEIEINENGEIQFRSLTKDEIDSLLFEDGKTLKKAHIEILNNILINNDFSYEKIRIPQYHFANKVLYKDVEFYSIENNKRLILQPPILIKTEFLLISNEKDFISMENFYLDPLTNEKIKFSLVHDKTTSKNSFFVEKYHFFKKDDFYYFSPIVSSIAYSEFVIKIFDPNKIPVKLILENIDYFKKHEFIGLENLPKIHSLGPQIYISITPLIRKNELNLKVKKYFGYSKGNTLTKEQIDQQSNTNSDENPFPDIAIFKFINQSLKKSHKKFQLSENGNYAIRNKYEEKRLHTLTRKILEKEDSNNELISQDQIINFFEISLKKFKAKKFNVHIHKDLLDLSKKDKPSLDIEITSSGIDWFDMEILIPKEYKKYVSIFMKAIRNNQEFTQIQENKWVSLESLGLKKFLQSLIQMGIHSSDLNKVRRISKGEAISFMVDYDMELNLRTDNQLKLIREELKRSLSFQTPVSQKEEPLKNIQSISGKNFKGILRNYQIQGVEFLNHLTNIGIGGILADDMGLGKTIQCLAYLNKRFEKNKKKELYLIVGPLASLSVWNKECNTFSPELPVYNWHGQWRDENSFPQTGIILTTFGTFVRDSNLFIQKTFDAVIIDEAQNIKNYKALASRYLRKIQSKLFFCVTGTPIENNLLELWAQFDLFFPGYLGNKEYFKKEYSKLTPKKLENLKKKISPFILRRTKSEVLKDLPEKTINQLPLPMTDRQKNEYNKARAIAIVELKNAGSDYLMKLLPHLMKLRRIACHPDIQLGEKANPQHSGKFIFLEESIDEFISSSNGVLVFSQFTDVLAIFGAILTKRKIPFFVLDGKTSANKRKEMVEKFQAGENHFFLISLKAGGTSLTLTRANLVLHLDPWWNPAVENQAIDRVHRIGQKHSVFVYKLYSEDTIESKVLELQKRKMDLFDGIFNGSSNGEKVSKEDLLKLLS